MGYPFPMKLAMQVLIGMDLYMPLYLKAGWGSVDIDTYVYTAKIYNISDNSEAHELTATADNASKTITITHSDTLTALMSESESELYWQLVQTDASGIKTLLIEGPVTISKRAHNG